MCEEDQRVAKDPVCGMDVDPRKAAAQSKYQGQVIYFCAVECKVKFDADPARYTSSK
jgi:P-type Cu+ transporter